MLNEQTIKFELRGSGPPDSIHVLLKLVIFMAKQKSPKQILKWLFTAKNVAGSINVTCFSYLRQVTKFNLQFQDFKSALDLICKYRKNSPIWLFELDFKS